MASLPLIPILILIVIVIETACATCGRPFENGL
jgi:hypothetical protein